MMRGLMWAVCIAVAIWGLGVFSLSVAGGLIVLCAALPLCPPVWDYIERQSSFTYRKSAAGILFFVGMTVYFVEFDKTPEGKALAAQQKAEQAKAEAEQAAQDAQDKAALEQAEASKAAAEDAEKASGKHCFSGWDGSVFALKEGVKNAMRNPDSFDHAETTYRRKGDLLHVQMTYRGQNGFGGMNIERITATIEPRSCAIVSVGESVSL